VNPIDNSRAVVGNSFGDSSVEEIELNIKSKKGTEGSPLVSPEKKQPSIDNAPLRKKR